MNQLVTPVATTFTASRGVNQRSTLQPSSAKCVQLRAAKQVARGTTGPRRGPLRVRSASGSDSGGNGEREPWDFGRFVKTVLTFNEPPSISKVFSSVFGESASPAPESCLVTVRSGPVSREGIVLVAGATGGVGKRVVERLLANGWHVRGLVRDVAKARELFAAAGGGAGRLELAPCDLTQPATLLPEFFAGASRLVNCAAVKVAPKEGDTEDRSKYLQGIKFYDPRVVGDTPQAVELRGVQNLLKALPQVGGASVFAVSERGEAEGQEWGALDDVVMGGASESSFRLAPAGPGQLPVGLFEGNVTTANRGGFASVRTKTYSPKLDLSGCEGLALRVKGNGQRFKAILRQDSDWDGIAHCFSFDTLPGQWHTVELPFAEFQAVFRAKTVEGGPALDPSELASFQLMLSKFEYDGELNPSFQAGRFELPIEWIRGYVAAGAGPRVVHVGSAGATRWNRPGLDPALEPPAVGMNDALGGILTYKLAGEDAVRASGAPFCVIRPCALTEEPRGMPLVLDQGDVLKGKISRDDVADLCVAVLDEPAAAGLTFEVASSVPFSEPWQGGPAAEAPRDFAALLAPLQPGVTGKTINGRYTGKEVDATASEQVQAM